MSIQVDIGLVLRITHCIRRSAHMIGYARLSMCVSTLVLVINTLVHVLFRNIILSMNSVDWKLFHFAQKQITILWYDECDRRAAAAAAAAATNKPYTQMLEHNKIGKNQRANKTISIVHATHNMDFQCFALCEPYIYGVFLVDVALLFDWFLFSVSHSHMCLCFNCWCWATATATADVVGSLVECV